MLNLITGVAIICPCFTDSDYEEVNILYVFNSVSSIT